MTKKVAVVYGGFSNERDVSIKSGINIAKSPITWRNWPCR